MFFYAKVQINIIILLFPCRSPTAKDVLSIVDLHMSNTLKSRNMVNESFISRMSTAMIDVSSSASPKQLTQWINSLEYYPSPENENDVTLQLFNAGNHLFCPSLNKNERNRWESSFLSKV